MTGFPFRKLVGAGNSFVLVDEPDVEEISPRDQLARTVCDHHSGIGADGLIVVRQMTGRCITISVINPDGSIASMCGNAVRLAAFHAADVTSVNEIEVELGDKRLVARRAGLEFSVDHPRPMVTPGQLRLSGHCWYRVDSGTDHVVAIVENVNDIDIKQVGKSVRWHPTLAERGSNVDVVEVVGPSTIHVRTYERGVEGETLSCGSGALASTAIVTELGLVAPGAVTVRNQSGRPMTVTLTRTKHARVTGPCEETSRGYFWTGPSRSKR